jgi:glycosyltransferase involved in cell wall biosynthesis
MTIRPDVKPFAPPCGQSNESGRVRVAFISHTSILGGAERVLIELVEGLQARGVDCLVCVPAAGPLVQALQRIGVRHEIVKYSWWSNPVHRIRRNCNNVLAIFKLARLFKRERIDLVYSNSSMVPSGAFAAKLCGLPHIWHVHEFGKEDHGLVFDIGEKLGMQLIGALSAKVICVSQAVEAKFAKYIPKSKLTTVYATVSLSGRGAPRPDPRFPVAVRCVLTGVIRPSKGQREAIEAIDLLVKEGLDIGLTLVGSGPMEEEMRELIASKHLEERIEMVGYVDNPFPFVESADIVLMCSRCEAFARPPLEGMMLGKPIVGSRSGGTVEAVRDHFNGLLYTSGDVRDLAEKIKQLAENLEYARALGENGREWANHKFTAENFIGGVLEIIDNAVQKKV